MTAIENVCAGKGMRRKECESSLISTLELSPFMLIRGSHSGKLKIFLENN